MTNAEVHKRDDKLHMSRRTLLISPSYIVSTRGVDTSPYKSEITLGSANVGIFIVIYIVSGLLLGNMHFKR